MRLLGTPPFLHSPSCSVTSTPPRHSSRLRAPESPTDRDSALGLHGVRDATEPKPGKEFLGLSRTGEKDAPAPPQLIPGCPRAGLAAPFTAALASPHLLQPQAPGRSQQNRSVSLRLGPLTDMPHLLKRPREIKAARLFLDLSDRFF